MSRHPNSTLPRHTFAHATVGIAVLGAYLALVPLWGCQSTDSGAPPKAQVAALPPLVRSAAAPRDLRWLPKSSLSAVTSPLPAGRRLFAAGDEGIFEIAWHGGRLRQLRAGQILAVDQHGADLWYALRAVDGRVQLRRVQLETADDKLVGTVPTTTVVGSVELPVVPPVLPRLDGERGRLFGGSYVGLTADPTSKRVCMEKGWLVSAGFPYRVVLAADTGRMIDHKRNFCPRPTGLVATKRPAEDVAFLAYVGNGAVAPARIVYASARRGAYSETVMIGTAEYARARVWTSPDNRWRAISIGMAAVVVVDALAHRTFAAAATENVAQDWAKSELYVASAVRQTDETPWDTVLPRAPLDEDTDAMMSWIGDDSPWLADTGLLVGKIRGAEGSAWVFVPGVGGYCPGNWVLTL